MSFRARIRTSGGSGARTLARRMNGKGIVKVGIIDPKNRVDDSDLNTAEIGFVHEFGSNDGTIPERSFIRSTLNDDRKEIGTLTKRLYRAILRGKMDSKRALGLLGADVADRISQKVVAIRSPANSPQTIARKGSSNPLVDTGQLKNSITWQVVP